MMSSSLRRPINFNLIGGIYKDQRTIKCAWTHSFTYGPSRQNFHHSAFNMSSLYSILVFISYFGVGACYAQPSDYGPLNFEATFGCYFCQFKSG